MGVMNFTGTVIKNLFSKPATRRYPERPHEYMERTRGHVIIDIEQCILCGMCQRKCPTGAISVDRNEKTWKIERFNCVQCSCCVKNCPKHCLSMGQEYTEPGPDKLDETVRKES